MDRTLNEETKTASCVLHIRGDFVLSVSRKEDPSKFGLPGGKVDFHEESVEAASRELYEETGIITQTIALIPIYSGWCDEYWVTTYLDVYENDKTIPIPEEGLEAIFVKPLFLTDSRNSPFSEYNRKVFEAIGII